MQVKRVLQVSIVMLFILFTGLAAYAQQVKIGEETNNPVVELKKTIIFIGKLNPDGKPQLYATGFLVNVQGTYHLITAKHVVVSPVTGKMQDEDMLAFFNLKSGGVTVRSIPDIKEQFNVDWIFHSDPKVDVAIIPFPIDTNEDDVMVISDKLFLPTKYLFELYDIFFMSYQPGIEPHGKITPIVRSGIISLINDDKTFYIDASAFPGNTGSPVFLKPSAIRFNKKGVVISNDPLGGKFIGIIGEYIPYQEVAISAKTGRPRIIFEENTGLSRVWSATFIEEIIKSDTFMKQLKQLSGK